MRQVPRSSQFLIIGRGRLARHLEHYFTLQGLSFRTYNRHEPIESLKAALTEATHVLLAISDGAIDAFCSAHASLFEGLQLVHFSGSLVSAQAAGAHPLMTFSRDLYTLETYHSIAFVTDGLTLKELLPGLTNSSFAIDPVMKPIYHAWCVMSGNFSTLLWEGFFTQLESQFSIPRAAAFPYLQQLSANLVSSQAEGSVLTGPLVRGDQETLERNFAALKNSHSPFAPVYTSFVESYARSREGNSNEVSS